jgi:hypothetical protein
MPDTRNIGATINGSRNRSRNATNPLTPD